MTSATKVSLILGVPQQAGSPATWHLDGSTLFAMAWDQVGASSSSPFACVKPNYQSCPIGKLSVLSIFSVSWAETRSQHHSVCLNRHISINDFT